MSNKVIPESKLAVSESDMLSIFEIDRHKKQNGEERNYARPEDYSHPAEQKLSRDIRECFELFGKPENLPMARISEANFVQVFLPMFTGDDTRHVTRANWESLAGGYYNRVEVVNQLGEVIYTVPPLLDRSALKPVFQDGHNSVSVLISHSENLSKLKPSLGQNFLEQELKHRAMRMQNPADSIKHIAEWNAIYNRYGAPLVRIPGYTDEQLGITTKLPAPGSKPALGVKRDIKNLNPPPEEDYEVEIGEF